MSCRLSTNQLRAFPNNARLNTRTFLALEKGGGLDPEGLFEMISRYHNGVILI